MKKRINALGKQLEKLAQARLFEKHRHRLLPSTWGDYLFALFLSAGDSAGGISICADAVLAAR